MAQVHAQVACTVCQETFEGTTYARAKSARDVHTRLCVRTIQVEYANRTVDRVDTHLVKPPYLEKLGIVFNTQVSALICLACAIAIAPSHIVEHVKNKHGDCELAISRELLARDIDALGVDDELPTLDQSLRPEVQGLALHTGLQCDLCPKIYVSPASMLKHCHTEHEGSALPSSWPVVFAQQLDHSLHRSYFPVSPAAVPQRSPVERIVDDLRAAMESLDGKPTGNRLDARLVSPWLKSNRWPELIKDKSIGELRAAVSPLKANEFPLLVPAVHRLFLGSEDMFDLVPELILQRLNTPDPLKTGINNQPFHRHQDHPARMRDYTSPVIRLLAMLVRKPTCTTFELPQEISERVESLKAAMIKPDD
ncbi:hypothetical protein C0993_007625, partial [Termitomyces sp. T159_Od127]